MNKKFTKTYILAIILVIAIAVLALPKYIMNGDDSANEPKKVFSFEIGDVNKIELEYPDQMNRDSGNRQTAQLQKVGDKWIVATNNNYKARKKDIATILEKATAITQGDLVSSNPDRQEALEIGPQKGSRVKLFQDTNLLADFWLGKNGARGNNTYFRLDGSDLVYETKTNIRFYFQKPDWIDKSIVSFGKEQVNKITLDVKWPKVVIERETGNLKLEIGDDSEDVVMETEEEEVKWNVISPQKFAVDENKMNSLLSSLSNLSAQDIVFDKTSEEIGLDSAQTKVIVEAKDSVVLYELIIGDKIEAPEVEDQDEMMSGQQDKYYVKLNDNDQVFTIGSYLVENSFSPELDELRVVEE